MTNVKSEILVHGIDQNRTTYFNQTDYFQMTFNRLSSREAQGLSLFTYVRLVSK